LQVLFSIVTYGAVSHSGPQTGSKSQTVERNWSVPWY